MSGGAVSMLAIVVALVGYGLGVERPPCCPGEQRSCYTEPPAGQRGVTYCRKSGFGWERCQAFKKSYPQALWRGEDAAQ